jgi:hypothetical protein
MTEWLMNDKTKMTLKHKYNNVQVAMQKQASLGKVMANVWSVRNKPAVYYNATIKCVCCSGKAISIT